MGDLSLIDGAVPVVVLVLGGLALLYLLFLLARRGRTGLLIAGIAVYLAWKHIGAPRTSMMEAVEGDGAPDGGEGEGAAGEGARAASSSEAAR